MTFLSTYDASACDFIEDSLFKPMHTGDVVGLVSGCTHPNRDPQMFEQAVLHTRVRRAMLWFILKTPILPIPSILWVV